MYNAGPCSAGSLLSLLPSSFFLPFFCVLFFSASFLLLSSFFLLPSFFPTHPKPSHPIAIQSHPIPSPSNHSKWIAQGCRLLRLTSRRRGAAETLTQAGLKQDWHRLRTRCTMAAGQWPSERQLPDELAALVRLVGPVPKNKQLFGSFFGPARVRISYTPLLRRGLFCNVEKVCAKDPVPYVGCGLLRDPLV